MNPLAWLGNHSSAALAALVVVGIAVPQLGELFKNGVSEAIILLLFVAFLRLDLHAFRGYIKNPKWVIGATCWTMVVVPLLLISIFNAFSLGDHYPQVYPALVFQASASPLMAAPAFAMLLGLDATLVLMTLVISTALTPLLAPIYASIAGVELSITPTAMGLRLLLILTGTALAGVFVQRLVGISRLNKHSKELDGINVLLLLVFICAILGNVREALFDSPYLVLGLSLCAFFIFFSLFAITTLVFAYGLGFANRDKAFSIALLVSNRNMGLLIAATGSALPEMTWIYFAVAQLPIYFCPQILSPLIAKRR